MLIFNWSIKLIGIRNELTGILQHLYQVVMFPPTSAICT